MHFPIQRLNNNREGMALLVALMAVIMVSGAVAIVMVMVHTSAQFTNRANNDVILDEACKAAVDMAIERVWNQYIVGNGNTTGNLASYRLFINNIVGNNEVLNGVQRDYNGDGTISLNPPAVIYSQDNTRLLPNGAVITGLEIARCDETSSVILTLVATAQVITGPEPQTKSITQTVKISGAPFAGFQFAVLANNINCILCHAQFLNMDMYKLASNGDIVMKTNAERAYGTSDRIKVAALESLLIRTNEADSFNAGSWYTRGNVYDKNGNLLSASGITAAFTSGKFGAYAFSSTNGKITQNSSTGAMTSVALTNAAVSNGSPEQFANLYLNYPKETTKMTDGPLPETFPPPFPDENNNRVVDTAEFVKTMNTANGSITGGIAVGVPPDGAYDGATLPTSADSTTMTQLANGTYDGNLILVGTESNPIVIDKNVAVNGDVVIKGVVKGYGALQVRGNVYVVGDVTYADAPGKFGEAADGTENAFALEAGGNILMGDYTTRRAKNNYVATKSGTGYIDSVDTGVWQGKFTRVDQTVATATMSNGKTTNVGYMDPSVVDPGVVPAGAGTVTSTYTYKDSNNKTHTVKVQPESQCSFTTSELMLFNRMEYQKWAPPGSADHNPNYYIPNYTPRYYKLRDDAGIYMYRVTSSTSPDLIEHVVNYASPGVTALSTNPSDTYFMGTNATVMSLAPKNGWISESTLRKIWYDDEAYRRANPSVVNESVNYSPFRFDGLLYTNNSIFGVIRSNGRHKSQMYGKLWIRGGIVCADLGLLSTDNAHTSTSSPYYGGIEVYYDKRVTAFLNIVDPTQVVFARSVYQR
ncbi:MAG TPA: hypothetical protein PK967_11535 [Candidatus Hydrogenedentes bacterium]|nr:hypothetical protein [Candidatus Hydrogenedentota bacterium]